jgi:RNA-binding protein Musashi
MNSQIKRDFQSAKERSKIFVGGLHWLTAEESFRTHFERFGQVTECVLMRDASGKSRCFGFVSYADPAVIDAVVRQIHVLDGKQVDS